jgi:predicted dehydrogenase
MSIEAASRAGHKPRLFIDYRKMLDEMKEIDAVVVATPVDRHIAPVITVAHDPYAGRVQNHPPGHH